MDRHGTKHVEIPKWSALLVEAVNKPGMIMEAYSAFHQYSIGNQILALVQCQMRGLEPGPINTFPGWQALGRSVKRGERALLLCMPITRKARGDQEGNHDASEGENGERTFTSFMHKARWFVISQTIGDEFTASRLPEWEAERALAALDIERIAFTDTDGNCQGYARKRQIAINPVAQLPHKTLFHETAHVLLGHTSEADFTDIERTPKNLREVEAEAVALLCCEALNLEGADYCRGYIQRWLYGGIGYDADAIPEKSAQKIFRAADQILRAGRLQPTENERESKQDRLGKRGHARLAQAPTIHPSKEKESMRRNHNTNIRPSVTRFALGQTYITPGAEEALQIAGQTAIEFLRRHMSCDWGELSEDDVRENELSLKQGFRLLSNYRTGKGQQLWIITEADRSSTTMLLPSEY